MKDPLSLNLYTYCQGNPISLVDVDGHTPEGIWALNRTAGGGGGVLLYTLYNWLVQASPYMQIASQNVDSYANAANVIKDKIGDNSPGDKEPDPVKKKPNIDKIKDKFLKENGLDAHEIKKEYLGKKADISKFDLYYNKDNGQVYIVEKATKKIVEVTSYYIK